MRVLITGAGGFVGRHLRDALERAGHQPHGLGQLVREGDLRVDVTDARATREAVAEVRPDAVVHLAGMSSVAECAREPQRALEVNVGGTLNVAQAVLSLGAPCRLLVVSSGEVYGAAAGDAPVSERVEPDPMNVYGATKRAAEIVALQHRHQGLDVVIARPFNHIGAGQTPTFVLPSFAQQLVSVPRGGSVTLQVGNLSAVRDFSHVLDVVHAYVLLLDKGQRGEIYNVASGVGRSIESMLQAMVRLSGRAASVHVDPKRLRPVDLPYLAGETTRLSSLGWAATRTVEQALEELLESVGG